MSLSHVFITHTAKVKAPTNKGDINKFYNRPVNLNHLIIVVALYLVATANISFFKHMLTIYPLSNNLGFLISTASLLFALIWLVCQLLCYRPIAKIVLIALVLIASVCSYFTDGYGTIFDRIMLINSLQTDQAEVMGLMAPSFFVHLLLLGVLPAFVISQIRIKHPTWRRAILQKTASLVMVIALIGLCLLPFGDQYASFFRQHKMVRSYANPIMPIYSVVKLGLDYADELRRPDTLILHATDAKRVTPVVTSSKGKPKPKLMVFVVGETARADHISFNGYKRNTMPLLAQQSNIYSFTKATSCGTSTAYSVPCMFSYANRENYDTDNAAYNENVLDTLHKQGVNVIWRDNNSSAKGVADRVTFEDYKTPDNNPICDNECRDIGMLNGFGTIIHSDGAPKDTLILLHQMGNHGPAYYQRYPKAFETFKPVCKTNELSKCDAQSVINGYDNALRYTDYFLNSVIETLKPYEQTYDVVMVYMSDHGESLGENNIYLHGLPYSIAPDAQKQVPLIIWSPSDNGIDAKSNDKSSLTNMINQPVSHDFITPTLLSFFNITTDEVAAAPTFFKPTT